MKTREKIAMISTILIIICGIGYISFVKSHIIPSPNGIITTQTHKVSSFSDIDIGGNFEVEILQGDTNTLNITADENMQTCLNIKQNGNELSISRRRICQFAKQGIIKIVISSPQFQKIELHGETTLIASTPITSKEKIELEVSGASSATLGGKAEKADIDISGSSILNLQGNFKKVEGDVSGASTANISGEIGEIELDISGASEVSLNSTTQTTNIELSGASSCTAKGSSSTLNIDSSGASTFEGKHFISKDANIDASGASEIIIHATETLKIDASGASEIAYTGNAKLITSDLSGGASITKE